MSSGLISSSNEWKSLEAAASRIKHAHLRDLLSDTTRNESLFKKIGSEVTLDLSRCKIDSDVIKSFVSLFRKIDLNAKIGAMFAGKKINKTENRAVLHTALRRPKDSGLRLSVDGLDVNQSVLGVLEGIREFSDEVRSGKHLGYSGKQLTSVVCIGIGGSYLGPEFVYEALRSDYQATTQEVCKGRTMRFLANVDPIDVGRALQGLDPEQTLVIVISKTFTTAETMLNAVTVRNWVTSHYKSEDKAIINAHFCAVSTALEKTSQFGISRVFGFWDWVGGRFSVCSAVGILPLALHFGFNLCQEFLAGANMIDEHFRTETDYTKNVPVLLGMMSVWNSSFLGIRSNAILPYCQSLTRFVAHIQQLDMESNGKRVSMNGEAVNFHTGQDIFGEPGTNGQHSFYQLLHQGTDVISSDFIGFKRSTNPIKIGGEPVSNHDELMSNFFAQPDALAYGKVDNGGHKHFPGDRPSLSILMPVCDAFHVGALLALYEHRTAVQAFIWDINAFDQWGVELGKVLAKEVRGIFQSRIPRQDDCAKDLLLREYML
jgi:glucose-6-phosphate isomerase